MNGANWTAIRDDYEGGMSLRSVATKHGVSKTYIIEKRDKEQWNRPTTDRPPNKQGVVNRDVNAAVRVTQAIQRRQEGWTYDRIAQDCSYGSPGAARNAIQRELDRVIVQNIEEWRKDHTSRLEKMHEEVWLLAMDKKYRGRLFAFDRLIAFAEREARMLGLDAKSDELPDGVTLVREYGVGVDKV